MKSRELQKSQFPNFLVKWEHSKNSVFHLLPKLGKNEKSIKSNSQKSQKNLFVNWEKRATTSQEQYSKISFLNLWMNLEKLCPNLSFNVENEIGNLHGIRLLTF